MAVTVFKQSPLKAFTQSALKARGLGGVTNPTEEGQVLVALTFAPSDAHGTGGGIVNLPSVAADPLAAINDVVARSFDSFPVSAYAGRLPAFVHILPTGISNISTQNLLDTGTHFQWPRIYETTSPYFDDNGYGATEQPLEDAFPLGPNQTIDGQVFATTIQKTRGCQLSYWLYTSAWYFSGTPLTSWTNNIFARRARFRINSTQPAFLASCDLWASRVIFPSDGSPPFLAPGWRTLTTIDDLGKPHTNPDPPRRDSILLRNVRFMSSLTIPAFQYIEVPFPTNWVYSSPFLEGFIGSGVFCVYGETPAEWSARTGIPMT